MNEYWIDEEMDRRLEAYRDNQDRLEEIRRSNCPLHLDCFKTPTCPYLKEELCDYPFIGNVESPATKGMAK